MDNDTKATYLAAFVEAFKILLGELIGLCWSLPDGCAGFLESLQLSLVSAEPEIEQRWYDLLPYVNVEEVAVGGAEGHYTASELEGRRARVAELEEQELVREWMEVVDVVVKTLREAPEELQSPLAEQFGALWNALHPQLRHLWELQESANSVDAVSSPDDHIEMSVEVPLKDVSTEDRRYWTGSYRESSPVDMGDIYRESATTDIRESSPVDMGDIYGESATTDLRNSSPVDTDDIYRESATTYLSPTPVTSPVPSFVTDVADSDCNFPDIQKPVPLIVTGTDGKWRICEEAGQILQQIHIPIAAVTIVGKYRTGKSYLMNLLAGSKVGFALGSTVQAVTKGIWMWPVRHPEVTGQCLLLLDTEGLYDVAKGDARHDMQLFTLAVLLSACLVFNAMGTIDDVFMQQLHLVAELSANIRMKRGAADEQYEQLFSAYLPHLVLVLRDFFLELKDEQERQMTADEYLESSLKLKKGSSLSSQQYNAPRESIRKLFPNRKCFTLPKPVADDANLRDLENCDDKELRPEFLRDSAEAVSYILQQARPLLVEGRTLQGHGFLRLLEAYIAALNEGAVPCVESAVEVMRQREGERAARAALQHYKQAMERVAVILPVESGKLLEVHSRALLAAVAVYRRVCAFHVADQQPQQLQEQIDRELEILQSRNASASAGRCYEALSRCFALLHRGLHDRQFIAPGGYAAYRRAVDSAVRAYKREAGLGPQRDHALRDLLDRLAINEHAILDADQALTEQQKQAETQQRHLEEKRREVELLEAESLRQLQKQQRQEQEQLDFVVALQLDFEEKHKQLQEEQERRVAEVRRELGELMQGELDQQAQHYQQALQHLQQERERAEAVAAEERRRLAELREQCEREVSEQDRREREQRTEAARQRERVEELQRQNNAEAARLLEEQRHERELREQQQAQARRGRNRRGCAIM